MKVQMTTDFGQAKGVQAIQWFATLMNAQDYCELVVKKYYPAQCHKEVIADIQASNVKGLTNIMTGTSKFKFEWID